MSTTGRNRYANYNSTARQQRRKKRARDYMLAARRSEQKNPKRALVLSYPGYNFLPPKALTKLRYCTEFAVASGDSLNIKDFVIRANSINDPEYAVGGGQPLAHDQLATLYNEYRVHACKVKFTFTNASGVPTRICVVPNTVGTSFTSFLDACEQPLAKTKALAVYSGGKSSDSVSAKAMTKVMLGHELDDEEEAQFGSNPVNEWFFHCIVSTDPYTASNYIVGVGYIEVIYSVEIYDRISLARS